MRNGVMTDEDKEDISRKVQRVDAIINMKGGKCPTFKPSQFIELSGKIYCIIIGLLTIIFFSRWITVMGRRFIE